MKPANKSADVGQIEELISKWAKSARARSIEGVLASHVSGVAMFDAPLPLELRGIKDRHARASFRASS
jgi:ketosteroid isomerase-like protein